MSNVNLEAIRARADVRGTDVLDFYEAALELGYGEAAAEWADQVLTVRVMRARGAV